MNHIIMEYAGEESKYFLKVSSLTIMDFLLSLFQLIRPYKPSKSGVGKYIGTPLQSGIISFNMVKEEKEKPYCLDIYLII